MEALHRALLFSPEEDEYMAIDTARACLTQLQPRSTELDLIFDSVDSDYIKLRQDVANGETNSV